MKLKELSYLAWLTEKEQVRDKDKFNLGHVEFDVTR